LQAAAAFRCDKMAGKFHVTFNTLRNDSDARSARLGRRLLQMRLARRQNSLPRKGARVFSFARPDFPGDIRKRFHHTLIGG
jgi:hypothetical protein